MSFRDDRIVQLADGQAVPGASVYYLVNQPGATLQTVNLTQFAPIYTDTTTTITVSNPVFTNNFGVASTGFPDIAPYLATTPYTVAVVLPNGVISAVYPDQGLGGSGGGTWIANVLSKSSNFTAALQTAYLVTTGSSNITVTLPTAVGGSTQQLFVKKVDLGAGMVTINTVSSQTIDGYTVYDLINPYQYVTILSDGTNWQIIGD